jgi:hypothetical protein
MEHNNNQHEDQPHREKRKLGAPFGNQNARKHKLYAKALSREQRNALRAARRAANLPDVINVSRIKLAAALADPHADLERLLRATRMLMRLLHIEARLRLGLWGEG